MPQKTKAQLREELEEARRELADVRANHAAELATLRESERRLKESEAQLQGDVEELRRRAAESDRELTEVMVELSLAQDKVEKLEGSADRRVWFASPSDSTTDFDPQYSEVGSLIRLHEIEDARDDALEALDKAQWELDKMSRDSE
jgi:chromosome segregation ATPase